MAEDVIIIKVPGIDMNSNTEQMFEQFIEVAYGKGSMPKIPKDQLSQIKRAFYSGIGSVLSVLNHLSEEESDEVGMDKIAELNRDVYKFFHEG